MPWVWIFGCRNPLDVNASEHYTLYAQAITVEATATAGASHKAQIHSNNAWLTRSENISLKIVHCLFWLVHALIDYSFYVIVAVASIVTDCV